jgi:hypothetical protein
MLCPLCGAAGSQLLDGSTVRSVNRARRSSHVCCETTNCAIARVRTKADLQNSGFLKIAGDNAALKAGMEVASF